MSHACPAPPALRDLIDYVFGELDAARESELEAHYFSCADCSERLAGIVAIGEGIRERVRAGEVWSIVGRPFTERLAAAGLRLREYRVPLDGQVFCTVGPDDDLLVSALEAPLRDVQRLDLLVTEQEGAPPHRVENVPFDPHAGEVLFLPATADVRHLPACRLHIRLVAVEPAGERRIGDYTFNHSPFESARER